MATPKTSDRESICAEIVSLFKKQRSVKFGRVVRDPIVPTELPRTAFPAVYIESSDEDIEDIAFSESVMREGTMEVACVVVIAGKNRNTQLNVAIKAMEDSINADRTLDAKAMDCSLTRIEQLEAGDMSPFSSSRVVFTVSYVYTIE
jgi:hypothetical protein